MTVGGILTSLEEGAENSVIILIDDDCADDVIIAGGVYIMSGPRNVTVSDGRTARLDCDVDGFPDNISVDWIFDTSVVASTSLEVPPVEETRLRYRVDRHTASFTIVNATTEDAGMYTCSAYNGLGASAATSAYLNVTCMVAHHVVILPGGCYVISNGLILNSQTCAFWSSASKSKKTISFEFRYGFTHRFFQSYFHVRPWPPKVNFYELLEQHFFRPYGLPIVSKQ